MRIFVTGASGFIGSAIVPELIKSGHEVLGLARSKAGAETVARLGAKVHGGDLQDLQSLRNGAAESDAVIHTAFIHGVTSFEQLRESCEIDRRVIRALGSVLEGSDRPLIVTSGTGAAAALPGHLGTEEDPSVSAAVFPRGATEEATTEVAAQGVRTMVVRLPPSTHGREQQGLVTGLIQIARQKGVSAYVGEGQNRWAAGHRLDAASVYVLALEKGSAGARYHAVGEEGVSLREIADAIGRCLNVETVSIPQEEAYAHFGWVGALVGRDIPSSSALTRERLGWRPTQIGLIEDLVGLFTA
jgi:nucleoside-diphosphate-sugar epimerase